MAEYNTMWQKIFCRCRDLNPAHHCVSGQNPTRIQLSYTRYATLVGAISSSEGRGRSKTTFFVLPIVDLVRKHKNSKQKLKIENIGFKV